MEHCKEKSRLAEAFARAAEAYSKAAKALQANMRRGDVSKILEDIHRTSGECGKARRALQEHIVKHHC
jgi:hypothetical protein